MNFAIVRYLTMLINWLSFLLVGLEHEKQQIISAAFNNSFEALTPPELENMIKHKVNLSNLFYKSFLMGNSKRENIWKFHEADEIHIQIVAQF